MSKKQSNILDEFRAGLYYDLAGVEMDFTESLETLMQRRGVNKSELARRVGTSPAYITKIMRGGTNFTLETMVKLVRALEGTLHVRACATEDNARWFHTLNKQPQQDKRPQGYSDAVMKYYVPSTNKDADGNEYAAAA